MVQPAASPQNAAAAAPQEYWVLDNSMLPLDDGGCRLYQSQSLQHFRYSVQPAKWGTRVRGVRIRPRPAQPLQRQPGELEFWIRVTELENAKTRRMAPVTDECYIPSSLRGVPILIEQPGMLSDDEVDDFEDPDDRMPNWKDWKLPVGKGAPPVELIGSGAEYEVIYDVVAIRAAPSLTAPAHGRKLKGDVVRMFDWDGTQKWRKVMQDPAIPLAGWMLLDHDEFGPLLRPKGMPLQAMPVEPVCAAALQGDSVWLKRFIDEGRDIHVTDPGKRTPLMLAAMTGKLSCIALLMPLVLQAGGRIQEALMAADSAPTLALMKAIAGQSQDCDARMLQGAMQDMEPEAAKLVEPFLPPFLSVNSQRDIHRTWTLTDPQLQPGQLEEEKLHGRAALDVQEPDEYSSVEDMKTQAQRSFSSWSSTHVQSGGKSRASRSTTADGGDAPLGHDVPRGQR